MVTAVYSLGRVNGAEVWLTGWLICAAAFFLAGFLRKENRNVREFNRRLTGLLVVSNVADLVWFPFYYPNGEYANPGIAGAYMLLLWPVLLIAAEFAVRFWRKRGYHS